MICCLELIHGMGLTWLCWAGVATNAIGCQNMERDITVWSSASRHLRMNMLIRPIPITTQTGYMLEPLATLTGCDHSSPFRLCVEDLYRQERVV